jgi:hypothetical protein
MRSNYIIIALSALTLGFSVALWRASGETDLQTQAAQMALAAQAQSAALSEELISERKARSLAETAERSTLDQLAFETKARETAQRAHGKAADRAASAAQNLAEQIITTKKLETRLADLEKQFGQANAKIAAQITARKDVQVELYNAKAQLRTLSARLQEEIRGKEAAETAQAKAEADAKAATEKLALEVKGRQAASNTKRPPLNRRVAFQRQRQAAVPRFLTQTRN